MFKQMLRSVVVVLLALAPSLSVEPKPPMFRGPKSRLRDETNISWRMELPLPDPYPAVIKRHVDAMYAKGYFSDLVSNDLWHGHLLMNPGAPDAYDDPAALLNDTALFLYHTDEEASRWERERANGLPTGQRVPRSIVGFWDGTVRPAILLVSPARARLKYYEKYGTVQDDDIFASRPDLIQDTALTMKYIHVGRVECSAELQFLLLQEPFGRLQLADGRRYDVFLRCDFDPKALGLDGYHSELRPFLHDGPP